MSEPEDILLDAAHHATTFVRRLWSRQRVGAREEVLRLADVRSRLELFTRAAYGVAVPIVVAEPPAVPTWLARLVKRIPKHLVQRQALPSTDGTRLRLPRAMAATDSMPSPLETYRFFSIELAARVARGTPKWIPTEADQLLKDLFLIREAVAVDATLALDLPGLRSGLHALRTAALASRPPYTLLTPREQAVEHYIHEALASDPSDGKAPTLLTPEASLAWAQETAIPLRRLDGPYRGLPAVALWGMVFPLPENTRSRALPSDTAHETEQDTPGPRVSLMVRRPKVRSAPEDEDDDEMGMWMIQLDDPQEHVEDPMGLQRPTDRDDAADPGELADSLSELPEARLVPTPTKPREVLASEDPPPFRARRTDGVSKPTGIVYPEWDYRVGAYHENGATVREMQPQLGDATWAEDILKRRAGLLHQVRRRFERLRPRRRRLGRQIDGPEVDIAAYVTTFADRAAGQAIDDRLYEAVRPIRRDVALALLVDISASTDSWVSHDLRIIDVEKEALLIVCDALDALGDPYAILAFSGNGPEAVTLFPVKAFHERSHTAVRRRIAALEPDRYTRAGAAIRHATMVLTKQVAQHRLLLILSDGKPNDLDHYEGRYGVEDTRQAIVEARLQGLHPFCLTVDRQAPSYLPRIFGTGAYAVLQHPERLPNVLVEVIRRLVKTS